MLKIKICILLLTAIVLSSCTSKFIYNHLDWALEWYIDDLVTLNDDQEWQVRGVIESILKWHRKNQLPFYISSLEEAEEAINTEITLGFLKRFYFGHEKAWMNLKYQTAPSLVNPLRTLSNAQVRELEKNLQDQEKDVIKDYVYKSTEELTNERIARMIDRLDFWIGDLNKQQQQVVVDWSHKVRIQTDDWMKSRKLWQSNFVKIVKEKRHKPNFNDLLLEHFQNSRKYWPDGYEQNYYFNVNLTLAMIAELGKQLTTDQKEKLLDRVVEIRSHIVEIYKDD